MKRIKGAKPTAGTKVKKGIANSRQRRIIRAYPTAGEIRSIPNSRGSQEHTQQQEKSNSDSKEEVEQLISDKEWATQKNPQRSGRRRIRESLQKVMMMRSSVHCRNQSKSPW